MSAGVADRKTWSTTFEGPRCQDLAGHLSRDRGNRRGLRPDGGAGRQPAGYHEQRQSIARANLPLGEDELRNWILGQTATPEGITDIYLLTDEDDYNALASTTLHDLSGHEGPSIYQLAPPPGHEMVVSPSPASETLFGSGLDQSAMARWYRQGASIQARTSNGPPPDEWRLLFIIDAAGQLHPATRSSTPQPRPGDTMVLLGRPESAPPAPTD